MENPVQSEVVSQAESNDFSPADWVQDSDGKWILSEESKARSLALYYSGRLAYSREDTSKPIGRYNAIGEVIPFKSWVQE